MSKELVIAANRHEIKLGILEDDQLVEVFFQRANEYSLAGSIHKGRVTRVLPGMQSAFVDLGLERDTFLYVSDFSEEGEDFDQVSVNRESSGAERGGTERGGGERGNRETSGAERGGGDRGNREPWRGERGNRAPVFEKPAPQEASQAGPAAAAADAEPSAVAGAAAVETAPPSAIAARPGNDRPSSDRADRPEEGDRGGRGRRSRRRRNRGRGFPDSKYASEVSRPSRFVEPATAAEATSEAPLAFAPVLSPVEPVRPSTTDFSVLPGESLAKYTRSNVQPLDDAEVEEIRDLQESETAVEMAEEELAEEIAEPDDAPIAEDTVALLDPEAEPEAVIVSTEIELEMGPPEEAEELVSEVENEIIVESGASDTEPAGADIPLAAGAEQPPSGSPLSAQVREQGGRYMHRLPRRMRRKMRGGGPVEGRGETRSGDEPRSEGSTTEPAAGRPEQRSEPRTFSRPEGRSERAPLPSISELLKEGQEIIVQIAKEPLGQKGARITSHIALPGRYVVYMPTLEHTGVSRKIASDEERLRLKRILQVHHAGVPGGFIVRTAGEGKSEEDLAADMNFLFNLWLDIRQKAEKKPAPLLLHHDLDIVERTLRDQFTDDFKAIWVDNEELYESVLRFVQRFQPTLVTRVKLYTRPEPIFDAFNITAELEKALRPKVWLKSGGYIVINQTEALVAIDVNTGKYVGRSNRLEDTIVKTNTEAVKEIVRQVRLRDLGGIIVVDFIDMDERKNRQKVMQVLEDAMRTDRAPYKILQFNDFGLVAITRKRVKQSLERALCMPCPHCEGAGYVKSVQTIVSEILQEAGKIAAAIEGKDVMLRVHPDVAKYLKSNQNKSLEEIEEVLRRPVLVKADPLLHHEKFDLA
jgi:ribonuclease G